ncbi:MAG: hypothetical protein U0175_29295 [Caldilineaceae bacterium]
MVLVQIEYENLSNAMSLALTSKEDFYNAFAALYEYLLATQAHQRRLHLWNCLCSKIQIFLAQLEGDIGTKFYLVEARLARTYNESQNERAKASMNTFLRFQD